MFIMFMRVYILICRYHKCTKAVKLILFKSYCISMYGSALCLPYSVSKYKIML